MEKIREDFEAGNLHVAGSLDHDRELFVGIDSVDYELSKYLSEAEVIELRDHLNAIIEKEITA